MKREDYSASQFRQVGAFFRDSWVQFPDKTSESRVMRPRFATRDHVQEAKNELSQVSAHNRGSSAVNPFEDAQGRLPRGRERKAHKRGRTYHADHTTRTTAWNRPSASGTATGEPKVKEKGKKDWIKLGDGLLGIESEIRETTRAEMEQQDSIQASKSTAASALYVSNSLPTFLPFNLSTG